MSESKYILTSWAVFCPMMSWSNPMSCWPNASGVQTVSDRGKVNFFFWKNFGGLGMIGWACHKVAAIIRKRLQEGFRKFRKFLVFLSVDSGNFFVFTSKQLWKGIRSQGYKVNKDDLYLWADYVCGIFMFLQISKYDRSLAKEQKSLDKYYCIDNGIRSAVLMPQSGDKGRSSRMFSFWSLTADSLLLTKYVIIKVRRNVTSCFSERTQLSN